MRYLFVLSPLKWCVLAHWGSKHPSIPVVHVHKALVTYLFTCPGLLKVYKVYLCHLSASVPQLYWASSRLLSSCFIRLSPRSRWDLLPFCLCFLGRMGWVPLLFPCTPRTAAAHTP